MSRRVYIIGTDTGVGKTATTCLLLQLAFKEGISAVPFKPAMSGPDQPSDAQRLMTAARLGPHDLDDVAPFRYVKPLAPGLAQDPTVFLHPELRPHRETPAALIAAEHHLAKLEQRRQASLTLIEGAGGLHVPMPDGSWQEEWVARLAPRVLVIGRAGLGTINHTLLTIAALRAGTGQPVGFILVDVAGTPNTSTDQNAAVVEARTGLRCLAKIPHLPAARRTLDHVAFHPSVLSTLGSRALGVPETNA